MLGTHDRAWPVTVLDAVAGLDRLLGRRVTLTTTARLLPDGVSSTTPRVAEGELVSTTGGIAVLRVLGWAGWVVPLESIIEVRETERA
jgi:hypothetical protein